jgi:hypothetical protein
MTPSEIIVKEYGTSPNPMTPRVIAYGALPNGAYELSWGLGLTGTIWGVSVVWVDSEGKTMRDHKLAGCFHKRKDADQRIRELRKMTL